MVQEVNYGLISQAIEYYRSCGFISLNVPWFVSREAMEYTSPVNRRFCSSFLGDLVASGEQSFIQMFIDGTLKPGRWQCATPCFRDEPLVDNLHLNYFFKVELIEVLPNDAVFSVDKIVSFASDFFSRHVDVKVVDTDIGKDIISKGVELGSYGYREFGDFKWAYGTGIAEPRLSFVMALDGERNCFGNQK